MSQTLEKKKRQIYEKNLNDIIAEDFLLFLLEKWKISSGEHKGESYSLKDRPYMLEIIQDDFPFKVNMKSAQCGLSEVEVARSIWSAIFYKGNQLYTLPAGEQMQQFVDARARDPILDSPFLSKYVTGSLNLKKFSIGKNQIYFRGVQKRRQIITVDVSKLKADEIDEYDEGTLYTLDKRLGASKDPERVYFSTPTYHGVGISLYYYGSEFQNERGSDQRVWTIQCESCGKWNEDLIWEENVIDLNEKDSKSTYYTPDTIVICRFCKKALDRLSSRAEWIAKFPSNSDYCHGRHISKLFSPTANLNQMMLDSKNPLKEQEFNNSDLGRPYEPKGSRLSDEILDSVRGPHIIVKRTDTHCVGGADIGNVLHAIATTTDDEGKIKVVGIEELEDWKDLDYFYSDFKIRSMVVDANPDKKEALDFQEKHDDVWLAYYMQHLENSAEKISVNRDDKIVHVHRTLMMQVTSDLIMGKSIILPLDARRMRGFYDHLKSPIKALKQNNVGNWIPFYPKTKAPDHYYHALLYNLVATMLRPKPSVFKLINLMLR